MTVPGVEIGARKSRRRHYSPDWPRIAIIAAVVFLVVTVVSAGATFLLIDKIHTNVTRSTGEEFPQPKNGERVNVLVMGLDAEVGPDGKVTNSGFDNRRSDVMMLVSGDPKTKKVTLISIPRDTRVKIPGHDYNKINAAHAYGGPVLAMETVEDFLGVPVHYYVRTNFAGFGQLVDLLGGLEYTVEKDMKYSDPYQNLYINLKAGKQMMDGSKAIQYVRYRSDGDDITRVGRQQKFLRAIANKAFSLGNVLRLPLIVTDMAKYVDTNLDAGDMLRYANLAVGMNDADFSTVMIPGVGDYIGPVSYWIPDENATRALINREIKGIDPAANAKIKVEVLNGTAVSGEASRLADALRRDGFTVVRVANADKKDYTGTTLVIDRRGNSDNVDRLGTTIRQLIAKPGFKRIVDAKNQADFTIIVGSDYRR